jgi:hypothetical protein
MRQWALSQTLGELNPVAFDDDIDVEVLDSHEKIPDEPAHGIDRETEFVTTLPNREKGLNPIGKPLLNQFGDHLLAGIKRLAFKGRGAFDRLHHIFLRTPSGFPGRWSPPDDRPPGPAGVLVLTDHQLLDPRERRLRTDDGEFGRLFP